MEKFIIAQIFGLLGALAMLLSNWQKTRKRVLLFITLDSIFYFLQYIMLGALSGALANVVGIIRTLIFMYKPENKFLQKNIILYSIILIYVIVGVFTYDGLISTFPIIISIAYSIILWQDDVKKIRIGSAVMIFTWIIYNLSVKAYLGSVIETILFISAISAIIKIDILKVKKTKA